MEASGPRILGQTSWPLLAGLRFVLACIVMGSHLHWFSASPIGWAAPFEDLGGKAAVVGFLLVSGYAIAASLSRGESGFYRRRVLRIYPLYFVAILAAVGLECVSHGHAQVPAQAFEGKGWPTALGNLLLLQTFLVKPVAFDGPVWSLSVEFSYYVVAPLLWRMRRKWLVALVVLSAACHLLPPREDLGLAYLVLSKLNALKYLWCWVVGFLLYRDAGLKVDALALACAPLLLAATTRTRWCLVTYALAVVAILAARQLRLGGRAARVLDYLGDLSYPLYLFHVPALIFGYLFLGVRAPGLLVVFALVVAVAAYHAVDRYLKDRVLRPLILAPAVPATARP
jgi:peptidoglycan/LPS O-acetylase OafA/YrhL